MVYICMYVIVCMNIVITGKDATNYRTDITNIIIYKSTYGPCSVIGEARETILN